jgi:hypothetical protein
MPGPRAPPGRAGPASAGAAQRGDERRAGRTPTPGPLRTRATPRSHRTHPRSRITTALTRPTTTPRHSSSRLPILSYSRPLALAPPSRPPLTALSGSLLHGPDAHARSPYACRRPASGLSPSRLGWPARCLFGRSRKGGPARQRWTPLPRKPRREAKSAPEAGRRRGGLLRPPARDHQLETTSRRGPRTLGPRPRRCDVRACRS